MNKQEYMAPRAELIVINTSELLCLSDWAVDGKPEGGVDEDGKEGPEWGDND